MTLANKLTEKKLWDDVYQSSKRRSPVPRSDLLRLHFELDRTFKRLFPRQQGLRLLEVGCGDSVWLPYFNLEFGYQVDGIDYSEAGCDLARQNLSRADAQGNVFCQDMFHLDPSLDQKYDLLISFGVIEHFEQPAHVIGLLSRLLKPGGRMFTYIPNLESVAARVMRVLDRSFYDSHFIIQMPELENGHTQNGMIVEHSLYLQFLDFSILGFTTWPLWLRLWAIRAIKAADLIPLYFFKLTSLNPQSQLFNSSMAVLARKY